MPLGEVVVAALALFASAYSTPSFHPRSLELQKARPALGWLVGFLARLLVVAAFVIHPLSHVSPWKHQKALGVVQHEGL